MLKIFCYNNSQFVSKIVRKLNLRSLWHDLAFHFTDRMDKTAVPPLQRACDDNEKGSNCCCDYKNTNSS